MGVKQFLSTWKDGKTGDPKVKLFWQLCCNVNGNAAVKYVEACAQMYTEVCKEQNIDKVVYEVVVNNIKLQTTIEECFAFMSGHVPPSRSAVDS